MSVALLVMTDGRKDCIRKTIRSAETNLLGPVSERYIHDDSGDLDYHEWLMRTFPQYVVIGGGYRRGFGGAIRRAWSVLNYGSQADFVFHLEDDFTFNRIVHLNDLRWTLTRNGTLAQMALRRQPWNDVERAAGGVVEVSPNEYSEIADPRGFWLQHDMFFTTNPSLYRMSLTRQAWPIADHSEGRFTSDLLKQGFTFGYWGARDSGEWVTHIGAERVGTGY